MIFFFFSNYYIYQKWVGPRKYISPGPKTTVTKHDNWIYNAVGVEVLLLDQSLLHEIVSFSDKNIINKK